MLDAAAQEKGGRKIMKKKGEETTRQGQSDGNDLAFTKPLVGAMF